MAGKTTISVVLCAAFVAAWSGGGEAVAQLIPPQCDELFNSRPDDLAEQLEWFKQLRNCIEENRDLLEPSLVIEAPAEVDAGTDSYTISGYVGDDGSVPTLTINGEPVELGPAGEGAPNLCDDTRCANTLGFSLDIVVRGDAGEHRYLFEALDDNGNSVAEERVVLLTAGNRPKFKGDYHALIIGNGDYDFMRPVESAIGDAKAVAETLVTYYMFDRENVQIIINATRRDILSALTALKKTLGKNDRLFVYYAGHGYIDEVTGVGFWQAIDADVFDDFTWVSIDAVTRNIAGMQAKHVMVIADSVFPVAVERGTAYAQTADGSGGAACSADDRYFKEIDSWATRKLIVSGVYQPTANQSSGDHSVFAENLIRVLVENRDCYITSKQLYDRLSRSVADVSDQKPEWGTVANAGDEGSGEFTFILRAKPLTSAD